GLVVNAQTDRLAALRRFYTARGHAPLWVGADGVTPRAGAVLEVLRSAGREGLDPTDYITALADAGPPFATPAAAAGFELLLSDALLYYVDDLRAGRVAPSHAGAEPYGPRHETDRPALLAAAADAPDIRAA